MPIEGRSAETVEDDVGKAAADGTTHQSKNQRLGEHRDHDRSCPKPKCAQRRNLSCSRRDRGVHRVQGTENGTDPHQHCDQSSEASDEVGDHRRLLRIEIGLAYDLDVEPRIGGEPILEVLECLW